MTKVVIPDIDSGYNLTQINVALQQLADELNNKVLYRTNPAGEPNSMSNNLDMNNFQILNLSAPATQNSPARLRDVQAAISGLPTAALVPFTPAGTIAATTVQTAIQELDTDIQRIDNTFASYGAAGNGVTDDSAAIAAMAVSGDKVVDGEGKTYRIVTKVVFSAGIKVVNARFLFDGVITTRMFDITASDVTFENVIFDGNNKQPRYSLVYVGPNIRNPWFINCEFKNMYGTQVGSTVVNQMYALNINPYNVVGFKIDKCKFYNLQKLNNGVPGPATVGWGFVGGVCFNTEDGSDPSASQPTPSEGIVSNSNFDTIVTVLATGLSDNDVSIYDDADGVRTIQGTGATRLYVNVVNCSFRNVSKRAVKLRASGGTFSNSKIYASLGAYGMSTPIDIVNGCWANDIELITSSALPVLKVATLANSGDTTNLPLSFGIKNVVCGHAKVGVELTSAGAVPMAGMVVNGLKIAQCVSLGIVSTGTAPSTQSNMEISNFQITGSGNNCRAVQLTAASDFTGGWNISNVVGINADFKVEGTNNNIKNSKLFVTSSSYAGGSAGAALFEIGSGKSKGGQSEIDNVVVDASAINVSYLSATRPYLVLITADNTSVSRFKLTVPDGLTVSYAHYEGIGDNFTIDGFEYTGPGFCRQGHLIASNNWSVKNAVRKGTGATGQVFWSIGAAADVYEFQTITDFRPTTQPTINSSTATNGIAANVNTRSSHVSGGVAGVATTANINVF